MMMLPAILSQEYLPSNLLLSRKIPDFVRVGFGMKQSTFANPRWNAIVCVQDRSCRFGSPYLPLWCKTASMRLGLALPGPLTGLRGKQSFPGHVFSSWSCACDQRSRDILCPRLTKTMRDVSLLCRMCSPNGGTAIEPLNAAYPLFCLGGGRAGILRKSVTT